MILKPLYLISSLILAAMMFLSFLPVVQPIKPDFNTMEGNRVVHYFKEKADSLSGPEIIELQDANGLTVWFSRHIFKDVCLTNECKMIRLWLFWDGVGNYLGMEIPKNEPLTKSDHTEFDKADYDKLENILRNPSSMLKDMKQNDLIIGEEQTNPDEVDGYSGATRPGLEQVVVKDAVYTSYILWHTVYGPVRDTLLSILEGRTDDEYLQKVFNTGNPSMVSWGIKAVEENAGYHALFYPAIAQAISSDHYILSNQAMNYFTPSRLAHESEQQKLVSMIPKVETHNKNDIIWKLHETDSVFESIVLQLLRFFDQGALGIGSLNNVYLLIKPEHISRNSEVKSMLDKLAVHENAYIRSITTRLLSKNQ